MEIKFLSVGCGDGIRIRYYGNDETWHNIFIDGGTEAGNIYPQVLQKEIREVGLKNEIIDLWIITHIDDDHIGGILRFIKDASLRTQIDLSKTDFWFNYTPYDYDTGLKTTLLKSVKQGVRLRKFLSEETKLNQAISDDLGEIDLYGCKLTILTPTKAELETLHKHWVKEETIILQKQSVSKKVARPNDYQTKIGDFDLTNFEEDDSDLNASSITFLLDYNGNKVLFLADSHPSLIYAALTKIGYSFQNKLKLTYMQLAHHGSKFNTNDNLLGLIECSHFIVNADGVNKHNLPNKELFARLKKNHPKENLKIFVTHKNHITSSILQVDQQDCGIDLLFPDPNNNYIILNL